VKVRITIIIYYVKEKVSILGEEKMRLNEIAPGTKVKIIDTGHVTENVRRRLLDLGIMEGTVVCVKHALPLGGPLALEAGGQWIGIRRREAKAIRVEVV
jgi:ferrous iron transport protein A